MTAPQMIEVSGQRFVLLEEAQYARLCRQAGEAADLPSEQLPLPSPNAQERLPAVEYARVSLARNLIRSRQEAGLSQQELARLAGVRQETISRIETGKHTASTATIDKLANAIDRSKKKRKKRPKL